MKAYLALGSNLNDRRQNLLKAADALNKTNGIAVRAASPVYETPAAMLYATAKDADNRPYLNCSVEIDTTLDPFELLTALKGIEKALGRDFSRRWSPRPIDLDIIFYGDEVLRTDALVIPHKRYKERNFVLDALSWFKSVAPQYLYTPAHQPLIAGIVNVTPDSFSNGARRDDTPENFAQTFEQWRAAGVQMIDIGAESTRPNAEKLTAAQEAERLSFVFDYLKGKKRDGLFPKLSIDTYHAENALAALENGFDVLNDVNGFDGEDMMALATAHKDKRFVFMHHDDIRDIAFENTVGVVEDWLKRKLDDFAKAGIDAAHLYFDCGVGFGKTATQSLCLLQNIKRFQKYGVKLYVGHSRKSFMSVFTQKSAAERDAETLALSVGLASNVDLLRVHTPVEHLRALSAVSHLNNQFFTEA